MNKKEKEITKWWRRPIGEFSAPIRYMSYILILPSFVLIYLLVKLLKWVLGRELLIEYIDL